MAATNRYKLATWKFYYCLKWSCYLQNIFVNPCEFLGLCWVVFRSRNFADAKRKEVVCTTLGFFLNSASGNGIWALGSGISKKMGWEMGLAPPLQGPLKGYVPFCQTFFGFRQSRLFEFLCWPEKKSEIKLIHSVAACCSDLLNLIGSFFLFLYPKLSVFLWRNGRKSNSLTSGLYWDSSLEIIRILIQTIANSEDSYEFSSAKKPTNTHTLANVSTSLQILELQWNVSLISYNPLPA